MKIVVYISAVIRLSEIVSIKRSHVGFLAVVEDIMNQIIVEMDILSPRIKGYILSLLDLLKPTQRDSRWEICYKEGLIDDLDEFLRERDVYSVEKEFVCEVSKENYKCLIYFEYTEEMNLYLQEFAKRTAINDSDRFYQKHYTKPILHVAKYKRHSPEEIVKMLCEDVARVRG